MESAQLGYRRYSEVVDVGVGFCRSVEGGINGWLWPARGWSDPHSSNFLKARLTVGRKQGQRVRGVRGVSGVSGGYEARVSFLIGFSCG
jgi:hypothetical protein